MSEPLPAGGNILVYSKVTDPRARAMLRQLLDDLPGERVSQAIYEIDADDWEEGSWDEEVERMREIIDPEADTLIFWHVVDGRLLRTCIAGRYA